jgi:hypothetical protein
MPPPGANNGSPASLRPGSVVSVGPFFKNNSFLNFGYQQFTGVPDYYQRKANPPPKYYNQASNDKNLNWGETYLGFSGNNMSFDFAYRGSHWGQDFIHTAFYDPDLPRFERTGGSGFSFDTGFYFSR